MKAKLSVSNPDQSKLAGAFWPLVIIAAAIAALFWRSFLPEYVHFSNDGPLGAQSVNFAELPAGFTGMWDDLNLIGMNAGTAGPGVSAAIRAFFGAVGFAKFYQPFALFLLGTGSWFFFRALKFTPVAALLGGLATALNTAFFAGACWGVASAEIAIGFNFCALALVMSNDSATPLRLRLLRLALAGFCIGVNVMEAADVGALCSIFVAGYIFVFEIVKNFIPLTKFERILFLVAVNIVSAFVLVGFFIVGLKSDMKWIELLLGSLALVGASGVMSWSLARPPVPLSKLEQLFSLMLLNGLLCLVFVLGLYHGHGFLSVFVVLVLGVVLNSALLFCPLFINRCGIGIIHLGIVSACAGFLAVQVVTALVGQGFTTSGAVANQESPQAHWDWATQWSLPKAETLGAVVPGLFGNRMDTPNKMLPKSLEKAYQGGVYWGGVGRSPEIDRYFDSGGAGEPPRGGMMRFGYAGYYCGILVLLIAFWGVAQMFRKQNPVYSVEQKKLVAFWTVAMAVTMFLAWGRFAPGSQAPDGLLGYALLYKLPHFSDIRNPAKFFLFFIWAVTVLFAYGMDSLSRRQLVPYAMPGAKLTDGFDRKLIYGLVGIFGVSVIGWMLYSSHKADLVSYLQKVGYGDEVFATDIANFSIGQVTWFIGLLAVAVALLVLVAKGFFSGPRAKLGAVLIGVFIFLDLGRSNLPFIIHWDYKHKYEVGAVNPILDSLRKNPWDHRVVGPEEGHGVGIPFGLQRELRAYDKYFFNGGIYSIEWTQHHYLFYNIQSLDIIQMPRPPADIAAYLAALQPRSQAEAFLRARLWQLTNTRYLLGAVDWVGAMNEILDPAQKRFRIAQRFDLVAKPGGQITGLEDLTAALAPDGDLALIEFTGALPRVKLYSNWQVSTNDAESLKTLADPSFDPAQTVLISTPQKDLPAVSTNDNSGSVEFKSYSTKQIVFTANATAPSVLLLNDKFDPNWRVTVDGQPAEVLRCNFIMRGVQLSPGQHTVQFDFSMPNHPLFITLTAIIIALILAALLVFMTRKPQTSDSK